MNYIEAIDKRISRRSYLSTPIEEEKVRKLVLLIKKLNAESGLSILYIEDGSEAFNGLRKSYGYFNGVRTVIAMKGQIDDPHLREKCGYYGEELVLLATELGLGSCWVGLSFERDNKVFNKQKDEEVVCVITIGYAEEKKTLRERVIHSFTHRKSKSATEMSKSAGDVPSWFWDSMKYVQKAPSTNNSQKVIFEYTNERVTAQVPDTYNMDLVDLGIAKRHFEIGAGGKFTFGNPGQFEKT